MSYNYPIGVGAQYSGTTGPSMDAALALDAYLKANGCDGSSRLISLIRTFQEAQGISVDGDLGPQTLKRLALYVDNPYSSTCYTTPEVTITPTPRPSGGGAPSSSGGGGGGTTPAPSGGGAITPTPSTPATPVVATAKVESPSVWPWVIGLAALGGIGFMVYMQKKPKGRKVLSMENPVRGRKRRRRRY